MTRKHTNHWWRTILSLTPRSRTACWVQTAFHLLPLHLLHPHPSTALSPCPCPCPCLCTHTHTHTHTHTDTLIDVFCCARKSRRTFSSISLSKNTVYRLLGFCREWIEGIIFMQWLNVCVCARVCVCVPVEEYTYVYIPLGGGLPESDPCMS